MDIVILLWLTLMILLKYVLFDTHFYVRFIVFQDKQLIYSAFPCLTKGLTPMAVAHGLKTFELPTNLKVEILGTSSIVEAVLSSFMAPLDNDPNLSLCISLDAEWNITRTFGISIIQIAPHSELDSVFIIPVSEIFSPFTIL
jgi:hypothetical protein